MHGNQTAAAERCDLLAEKILVRMTEGPAFSLPRELEALPARQRFDVLQSVRFALRADLKLPAGSPLGMRLGRYWVERELDQGGMGSVFLARDLVFDRRVVLKTARPGGHDPADRERLQHEGLLLASVTHPSLPRALDCDQLGGITFLVLEHVPGQRLDRLLRARAEGGSSALHLSGPRLLESLFPPVVEAVAALHLSQIVHRDLKPGNVLVRPDGRPVVLDLGLAGHRDDEEDPYRDRLSGTVPYLAPEQMRARRSGWDPRTDVFQLGLLAFELCTGRRFVESLSPQHAIAQVEQPRDPSAELRAAGAPLALRKLLACCLRRDPHQRPRDAAELLESLSAALRCLQPSSNGRGASPPSWPLFAHGTAATAWLALSLAGLWLH